MICKKNRKIESFKEAEIIFCSFSPVGLEDYITYFVDNFKKLIYLKWKFPHSKGKVNSEIIYYKEKKIISKEILFSLPNFSNQLFYFLFLPLNYLIYFLQVIFLLWKRKSEQKRIFVGVNHFCTFCGIILKKMGRVDFVIYRVTDFFPLPPGGPYRFLNRIFYVIDKFCLKNADDIWFTTEGHIIGREKYGYFDRKKYNYQIIPLGLNVGKFISRPITERNKYSLVYCGVISRYHLLDLLFEVIWELKKDFKNIKLNLIGSGPDEEYFKVLSQKMGLKKNVIFCGFVEDGEKFRNLMANNILGIALYKDEENFMRYTEPAKVKYYLSFGVPAIISDVPKIARELAEKRVSFSVNNNKAEITEVIRKFILNKNLEREYKENIKEFVKSIDINNLLETTFNNTFLKI